MNPLKTIFAYAALVAGALSVACQSAAAPVKVWQGTLTLPTYEEGSPDSNPPFDSYATNQFSYPYTLRKNLTGQKQDHAWRAVFLENEYLKCSVLPDIGGHVYTCIDKINGQPMFYANPSIKKAQIGYRGAWAAFGIEFNFPVSHNWVSMSPVDYAYTNHDDGSASVTVGNIDRVYGMQWRVELILRPGSTVLEERVTLYNRSDVRHRYYWWNNAGIQVWDDSHIEYPMRFAASHGFTEVRHWPIGPEGSDLSVIENQLSGPVSYFVHGSREPFMGIWNPKTQAGTVHYAEYSNLPAKKIWSWGADADGLGWRKALSDNDSAYVEVQAGLFRNQETYAFLDPGQTIRFSEYWMPVRETGGISRANKMGVISLQSHGSDLSAVLNVNERVPGARVALLQGGQTLWNETADLTPENKWCHTVALKDRAAKVTFELKDREGKLLLRHTDGDYDWDAESKIAIGPQHVYDAPAAENRTEDDWLRLGANQELNGKVVLALETYEKGMAIYPGGFALQVAAGRLAASLQRFAEAANLLQAAQKQDTSNAEIAYYLGIAEDGLGHARDAQTAYEIAYRQPAFRARAAVRIAELQAQRGDLHAAQAFLEDGVDAAPQDIRTREQLEAITRAAGDTVHANEFARLDLAIDPLSDFLKEEAGKPDLYHLAADPYRVLRVAAEYMNLGLYQRALVVLDRRYPSVPQDETEPGSVLPQNHPLVRYYAAYCKAKLSQDTKQDLQAAESLSSSLVFPSSTADQTVLESAIAANRNDATAQYLLGTLLFSKGLYDTAIVHWTEAKRLNPKMPVLDADMGKAYLHIKNDPRKSLVSFRQGVENDPTNSDNYAGLDIAMSLSGAPAKDRAMEIGRYPLADNAATSTMPANLVYQLALTRAEAGEFDQALALFKGRFFPSEEGGISAAQVLFEIQLMQASANASAGNCKNAEAFLNSEHSGHVINEAVARPYVRMAAIAKTCRNTEQSEGLLKKAAESKIGADAGWSHLAQQSLGTNDGPAGQQKLEASLANAQRMKDTSSFTGWWWYNIGTMQAARDRKDQAREAFKNALLLPDSMMSHHLTRAAMADLGSAK
jgi:tetratricopeptide (TPR) repeat protein